MLSTQSCHIAISVDRAEGAQILMLDGTCDISYGQDGLREAELSVGMFVVVFTRDSVC